MSWTQKIFFVVVVTFLIFITARGDLPKWKQVFTTKMGSGGTTTTSSGGSSAIPGTTTTQANQSGNPLISNNPLLDSGSFDNSGNNTNNDLVSF